MNGINDSQLLDAFEKAAAESALSKNVIENFLIVHKEIAQWLNHKQEGKSPFVLGINGAQGAGKSTFSKFAALAQQVLYNKSVLVLSIDDLYLIRQERVELSKAQHPLLVTRGVPGTHDLKLGQSLLTQLRTANAASETLIPRFDKGADDRLPKEQWDSFIGKPDILIIEGWCIGARPQTKEDLATPVNQLESLEDEDLLWRSYVNDRLQHEYSDFFNSFDALLMLKVPSFTKVLEWRQLQEDKLRARSDGAAVMSKEQIERFIQHYERITLDGLNVLPGLADVVIPINEDHSLGSPGFKGH
jgi:D-glycerate 3-kinase